MLKAIGPAAVLGLAALVGCSDTSRSTPVGGDSPPPQQTPTGPPTREDPQAGREGKETPPPKEQSVEAYDSATHGAVQVIVNDENPTDSFDVFRGGKRVEGATTLLNGTLQLPPGEYVIDVNKTRRTVRVEAGKKWVLSAGQLKVTGEPKATAWYAVDGEVKLTSSGVEPLLNKALPLFAGTYEVFVDTSLTGKDQSLGKAEVKAGQTTVLNR